MPAVAKRLAEELFGPRDPKAAVEAYWAAWNASRTEREERYRRALVRSGKALRAALEPVLEAARRNPPASLAEGLKPWGRARALALPWEICGGYAEGPAVFCRRCRMVLSSAWACRCGAPEPAVLVPLSALAERNQEAVRKALEAAREAMFADDEEERGQGVNPTRAA